MGPATRLAVQALAERLKVSKVAGRAAYFVAS